MPNLIVCVRDGRRKIHARDWPAWMRTNGTRNVMFGIWGALHENAPRRGDAGGPHAIRTERALPHKLPAWHARAGEVQMAKEGGRLHVDSPGKRLSSWKQGGDAGRGRVGLLRFVERAPFWLATAGEEGEMCKWQEQGGGGAR
eukprot:248066-Chlamydomonas_euryale.AAC.2